MLILVDALDEGDPPEQQVMGFKGGVAAGGNKALALIVRLLADKLPHNVKFLFTTRPDAACGGIQDILARAFPDDGIRFVTPDNLRQDEESKEAASDKVMVLQTVLKECLSEPSMTAIVRKKWLEVSPECPAENHCPMIV